jgi:uncharacterized protein
MALTPGARASGPAITGFSGSLILVDGVARAGAVILTPEAVFEWDGGDLGAAITNPPPEFILLGTGATLVRPAPGLIARYEAQGIGIEAMDTRAAARVWTLLRSEGRWISAALQPL